MRFQKEFRPAPWFQRREQHRILSFLCLLMIIIVAIDTTRRPENWNWFFAMSQPVDELNPGPLGDVNFHVKDGATEHALPLDTFLAVAPANADQPAPPSKSDIRQIPKSELAGIQDQRLGHLRSEEPALARALQQVDQFPESELLQAGNRDVSFRIVNVDPDAHRGELLTLEGTLWRLAPWTASDPEAHLVQAWFFTEDSGNNPWVAILREKPADLAFGDGIDRQIQVAGYFFKRFGYPTEDGMHVAPMLVGKTLSLQPTLAVKKEETREVTYYVVGLLATIAVLFALIMLYFVISDRQFRQSRSGQIASKYAHATGASQTDLNQLTAVDPTEVFKQLQGTPSPPETKSLSDT